MKLLHPEIDTHGHERFVLHIGRDELKAIHRVVCDALQTLPRIPETTQLRSRIKGIRNDIEAVIPMKRPSAETITGPSLTDSPHVRMMDILSKRIENWGNT